MSDVVQPFDISLNSIVKSVNIVARGTQELLTRAIVEHINLTYTNISEITFSILHNALYDTEDSFSWLFWLTSHTYQYLYSSTIVHALSGWSKTYSDNVFKQNIVTEINYIWDNYKQDGSLDWSQPYYFINRYVLPRVTDVYNKATSFRNSLILYIDDLYGILDIHREDINMIFAQIANLNSTFVERVESVINPYFESWYAYWDYWYNSQWIFLIDQLTAFKEDYDNYVMEVNQIIEKVETQGIDLEEIKKKLRTPFSNVYELKDKDKESFEYQLHLLQTLIIEAFGLEFPSVREKMIENIDIILGKEQQKTIEGGGDYVGRIESRR